MSKEKKKKLAGPWRNLHAAVWMIGLAILFFTERWWPGILILVAFSMVLEAILMFVVPDAFVEEEEGEEKEETNSRPVVNIAENELAAAAAEHHPELLPGECPKCGAPIKGEKARWTGPRSADCPYCGASLPMKSS